MSSVSPTLGSSPVLRIEKSLPDNWSSNPLQVKSCFSIPLSSTSPVAGQFKSKVCGLGWSFAGTYESVKFETLERIASKRGGRMGMQTNRTVQKCRCKVSLSFHPGAMRSMPFGDLHIKTSVSEETIERIFQLPIELFGIPLGDVTQGNLSLDEACSFDVTVTLNVPTEGVPTPLVPRPTESEIMEVITASLDGEFPIDIKFVLFTRCSEKGQACAPRAVFATSKVLKGWGAFIDEYVMESDGVDIDSDGNNYEVSCDYPFEDDSDLESDGEPEVPTSGVADGVDGEHSSGDLPEGSDMIIDAVADGYTYSSELKGSSVECFSDETLQVPDLKQTASSEGTSGELHQTTSARDRTSDWNPGRPARLGSVKPIKDVAYTTFKSLIAWIYTGKIAFKPLKSGRSLQRDPSACSPKSMYRLATRAGLDELKKLAFDNLRSQLTEENIVGELFSTFSRDNPEVLEMELTVLLKYFSTTRVRAEWENMIDVVFDGGMPHGVIVIKRITRRLASSESQY
ncbi:hypothetical protein ARMSODRAFT_958419 [Armillaria solidipes]|uniref:BTB domain-containing protein n=1 Tax=Armillaria solidipes TaxID=1076256 RepID=A0A2H3BBP0_9AGAR|nr:hypothetical protein ARMSODRAFT_958419 [Armillaria solidipes]